MNLSLLFFQFLFTRKILFVIYSQYLDRDETIIFKLKINRNVEIVQEKMSTVSQNSMLRRVYLDIGSWTFM